MDPRLITVRQSPIHGSGVFSTQPLVANTVLGFYEGKRLRSMAQARTHWKPGESTFLWSLSNGQIVFGTNDFRFLNHSCAPNVEAAEQLVNGVLEVQFRTLRRVAQGAELFIDYRLDSGDTDPADYRCLCGSRRCRGTMLHVDSA